MSMLEKFCDAKNTFEGKALAAFMAAVLAFSLVNLSSLADAAENGAPTDAPEAQVDNPSTEAADSPAPEPAPAAAPEATATLETPAVSEAPAQSEAPATEPSAPAADLPTAEPGVAVVGLEFQHAYVAYLGQTIALPADSINVPLNKELSFAAYADEGYEISAVKAVAKGVEAELRADATTGEYKVPAEQVTSNLILKVEAKAAEAETSELETPAAEPITSDTKIGEDGAGGPEADGSDNGGSDAIGDDVVEVEADVSSPAFEGYAQAGNVLVKVTAAEGVLPEGTTVQAVQITSSAVIDAVEAAVEEKGKELENAVAVDVTLLGPDGNVIQPDAAVNVCFFNAGVSGEAMGVYHVANDGSSVSAVSARQADAAAQSFDVSHFSIYVVTAEGARRSSPPITSTAWMELLSARRSSRPARACSSPRRLRSPMANSSRAGMQRTAKTGRAGSSISVRKSLPKRSPATCTQKFPGRATCTSWTTAVAFTPPNQGPMAMSSRPMWRSLSLRTRA
ncbi:hypothetical protein NE582_12840 [Gordonibacter pamelaeae]|uniref:hypothetical protein n=1 Tax=Gordonibacter pamelaeae TaxID=471189 RepID=UPI00210D832E|nr:hypothetical protein [Gordonibacter pamelaeae]MCQ4848104.1 hypothetical protein [Gordonibacter pamelaeae]MCQ4850998.1 hypothetical protein [Gordonibacter pamelaeae]